MMKRLLFTSLFLLFSSYIFTQHDIRMIGGGVGISSQPYVFLNADIYSYYSSFHKTKVDYLYLTTGSKINYAVLYGAIYAGQRFGIGIENNNNAKYAIYDNIGIEINTVGLGLYWNKNILIKKKKHYFAINPEINVLLMNYDSEIFSKPTIPILLVGCSFATAWNKKEFTPKSNKKYGIMNHFETSISIGNLVQYRNRTGSSYNNNFFMNLSGTYRLFHRQIISPEVGLGFIVSSGSTNVKIYDQPYPNDINNPTITYGIYARYLDILPYIKAGFNIQTRGKLAFISNIGIGKMINFGAMTSYAGIGVKYSFTNKLATSICLENSYYIGRVWGNYQIYEKESPTSAYLLKEETKGTHYSSSIGNIYGIRLGVHF